MASFGNPLLSAYNQAAAAGTLEAEADHLQRTFAFGIPNEDALDALERSSPGGIVEMGAGTGYWARLLVERGVTMTAFDLEPAPSARNQWFAGREAWTAIEGSECYVASDHADKTLLIVWPTRNETWASETVESHGRSGGQRVAFVGEPYGGRNGDDYFHALLGEVDRCWACSVRVAGVPCVCGIQPLFAPTATVALPQWPGRFDALHLYEAQTDAAQLSPNAPLKNRPSGPMPLLRRLRGRTTIADEPE